MKLCVVIQGSPYGSQACQSALLYTKAALKAGHEVLRVFFYEDGVYAAHINNTPPQDERNVVTEWRELAESSDLELVACIASCLRRGILDEAEADRYEKASPTVSDGFIISGLGQLIDATLNADRVITFGA